MRKNNITGFAMLELIVSMGLIALVLLSLLSYQIILLQQCFQLNLQTIAHNQLTNFSDMLLVNTSNSERETAFSVWNKTNENLLPHGEGEFIPITEHQCKISVNWFFKKPATESVIVFC